MKSLNHIRKFIPYLYFISVIAFWFSIVNKAEGFMAYTILLLALPFARQLIRPSKHLNFTLGITFMCLSSYLIIAYLSELTNLLHFSEPFRDLLFFSGLLIPTNFVMSVWMIRNSLKESF